MAAGLLGGCEHPYRPFFLSEKPQVQACGFLFFGYLKPAIKIKKYVIILTVLESRILTDMVKSKNIYTGVRALLPIHRFFKKSVKALIILTNRHIYTIYKS